MLRNPSLYGITHDELEKDPLLEQVWIWLNPMDTWRRQLAFWWLNFVKKRVSSFFEINKFLILKGFGKATSGWTSFALYAQDIKICFVFSSNQCGQISWEVQNQGLLVLYPLTGCDSRFWRETVLSCAVSVTSSDCKLLNRDCQPV